MSRHLLNASRTHIIRLYSTSSSSTIVSSPTSSTSPSNDSSKTVEAEQDDTSAAQATKKDTAGKKAASSADADEQLRLAMAGIDGGGIHAVEIEGGQLRGLKRDVKANMFRVI